MCFISSQKLGADPELLPCFSIYMKWLHAARRTSAEMSLKWITLTSLPASANGLLSIADRVDERRTQVRLNTHTHTSLSQEMRTMCPEWESVMLSAFVNYDIIPHILRSTIPLLHVSSPMMMYHLSPLLHQFSAALQIRWRLHALSEG